MVWLSRTAKAGPAARADDLTRRAAGRAWDRDLLGLMIALGHYDPERHGIGDGKGATGGRSVGPGNAAQQYQERVGEGRAGTSHTK